jgi:hypothetical protein
MLSFISVKKFGDMAAWERCKQDHTTLVDYMYDTAEGAQLPPNDPKRPATDKYNKDLEKAAAQLETIKRNYPDCPTFKASATKDGKPFLTVIGDEIDFQRKIRATRDLLSRLAMDLADELQKQGQDAQAAEYRAIIRKQIQWLINQEGESLPGSLKMADLLIMDKKYDEAAGILYEVKTKSNPDSDIYFDASKRLSEVFALQGKWGEAAEYPSFVATQLRFDSKLVKERWPAMEAFLEDCFAHGVPRPAQLAPKSTGEPKANEPKKDDGAGTPVPPVAPVAPAPSEQK